MENIILNIWIDMKNGLKVRLLEKPGPEDTSFLISVAVVDTGVQRLPLPTFLSSPLQAPEVDRHGWQIRKGGATPRM